MNVTYTGKQEYLQPAQRTTLDSKFAKIGKLLDGSGKGGKQAHVILQNQRNQHHVEITLNYLDHQIAGECIDTDQFTALSAALDRIEKQMLKVRDKRRDTKKGPREGWDKEANSALFEQAEPPAIPGTNGTPRRVYRVIPADSKPMTLDEALLAIDSEQYLVYQDAGTQHLSVLMRRDDGHFDLVEC